MNDDFDSVCIISISTGLKYQVWTILKDWENGWHVNVDLYAWV